MTPAGGGSFSPCSAGSTRKRSPKKSIKELGSPIPKGRQMAVSIDEPVESPVGVIKVVTIDIQRRGGGGEERKGPAKARNSAIHEGRMPKLLENLSGGSGGRDSSRQRKERSPVSDFTRRIALKKQSESGTGRNVVSYIVHP